MSHNLLFALVVKKTPETFYLHEVEQIKAFNCGGTAPLGGLIFKKKMQSTLHTDL